MGSRRHMTGLMTLLHCMATNRGYHIEDVPPGYMKKIVEDYKNFEYLSNKNPDLVPELVAQKHVEMKEIRQRLIDMQLI